VKAKMASSRSSVTIVTRIYTPEPSAGSMRLQALASELLRRGHEVRVITTTPPPHIPATPSRGEQIVRWPVLRDKAGYVRGYVQYLSFDLPLVLRMLFGRRTDLYIVEPPPTTGAVVRVTSWLRRRPYVYYAADVWSDAAQMTGAAAWVIGAVRAVEKLALRGAAENLAVSDGVVHRVRELTPGVPTAMVGHGVDTDLFSPDGARVPVPADIVYAGTMSEWHGAGVAIDALALVMAEDTDVTATFIGQGADKDDLIAAVERYGLQDRITFRPPMPAEEAAAWVRSARVALATLKPGAGYDFAVPTKLYAALAVGTPVAYSGPEPLRTKIVSERLGESAPFDAEEYARAISALLARSSGEARKELVDWANENVSALAVARRAADVVEAIGSEVRANGRV